MPSQFKFENHTKLSFIIIDRLTEDFSVDNKKVSDLLEDCFINLYHQYHINYNNMIFVNFFEKSGLPVISFLKDYLSYERKFRKSPVFDIYKIISKDSTFENVSSIEKYESVKILNAKKECVEFIKNTADDNSIIRMNCTYKTRNYVSGITDVSYNDVFKLFCLERANAI